MLLLRCLLTLYLTALLSLNGCKKDKGGDSPSPAAPAPIEDEENSGGDDRKKRSDRDDDGDDDNRPPPPPPGGLQLSFDTDADVDGLPQGYSLNNGLDVPSAVEGVNDSMPDEMKVPGSLILDTSSFRSVQASDCESNQFFSAVDPDDPDDDECVNIAAPPPIGLAQLHTESGNDLADFYTAFLESCNDNGPDGTNWKPPTTGAGKGPGCLTDIADGSGNYDENNCKDLDPATTCIAAINVDMYGKPWDHDDNPSTDDVTYVFGGAWSRYFAGIGPTSIMHYTQQADAYFEDVEDRYNSGELRCLAGSHTDFTLNVNAVGGWDSGITDWPLACYLGYDQALGYANDHFYFASIAPNNQRFMKLKDDGKDIDVWNIFGSPSGGGSTGINHFKSTTNPDGSKLFRMNPMGFGMGPSCGTYMAFYTHFEEIGGTKTRMYFDIRETPPGSDECYDYSNVTAPVDAYSAGRIELCLDEDFNKVADQTECTDPGTAWGIDLDDRSDFPMFEELLDDNGITLPGGDANGLDDNNLTNTVPGSLTASYVDENGTTVPVNISLDNDVSTLGPYAAYISILGLHDGTNPGFHASGNNTIEIYDLWPGNHPVAIQDPLKVLAEEVLSRDVLGSMVREFEERAQQSQGDIGQGNSACAYEVPTDFQPTRTIGDDLMGVFKLSCSQSPGGSIFGYVNDEWNFMKYDNSQGLFAFRASTDLAEIWRINVNPDGSETGDNYLNYTAGIGVTRLLIDNVNDTKEFTLFGSFVAQRGAYCGVQLKFKGDLIFVKGRFTEADCSTTFDDQDCLRLSTNGSVTREDISVCYQPANADVTAFAFPIMDTGTFSRAQLESILSSPPADETLVSVQRNVASAPAMANTLSSWAAVSNLPLTLNNERFTRGAVDNGALSANCGHNGADQDRDISFTWTFAMSSLSATELADLNTSIAAGEAYVGYNFELPVATLGSATVSSNVSATANLKAADGGVVKTANIADHTHSAYALSGFLTDAVTAGHSIQIDWSGSIGIDCPDSPNNGDQASIRAFVKDLKLRFN